MPIATNLRSSGFSLKLIMSGVGEAMRENASNPATWLEDHGDYLLRCATKLVRDIDAAEDLVQETLVAAVKARDRFAGRSTVRTWLVAIMKHKATDRLRQAHHPASNPTRLTEEASSHWADRQFTRTGKWSSSPRTWPDDAGASIEREEFRGVLADCLSRLPLRGIDAIRLADQQGLSLAQIGELLSVTATHVGVILHRARLALRHCLELRWFTEPGRKS